MCCFIASSGAPVSCAEHEAAEIAAARTFNLGPEQRSWLIVRNGGKSVI